MQSEVEVDALVELEERIRRTVELVASLRSERDAALEELAEARKTGRGRQIQSGRWWREAEGRTRYAPVRTQAGAHAHRKTARANGPARFVTLESALQYTQDFMERKSVRVTIYNQPYTLAVSGDPGEFEALASSVDALMTNIAQRAGNVDGMKVAVLALQLADQARGMEQELATLKSEVGAKSRNSPGCWTRL